jgi:hypothetical protein
MTSLITVELKTKKMKYSLLLAAVFCISTVTSQEQRRVKKGPQNMHGEFLQDLAPDEVATLETKKMTLDLDLTEGQQNEIYAIKLDQVNKRRTKTESRKAKKEGVQNEKPSKEERFQHLNNRLDAQIAHKKKMKQILNTEQYQKWQKSHNMKSNRQKLRRKAKFRHKRR